MTWQDRKNGQASLLDCQVKEEGWWVVLGDPSNDELHALKRVSLRSSATCSLAFQAEPEAASRMALFLVCDSYVGLDQQYNLALQRNQVKGQSQHPACSVQQKAQTGGATLEKA